MAFNENCVNLRAHRGIGAELFDTFIAAEALHPAFFKVQVTPTQITSIPLAKSWCLREGECNYRQTQVMNALSFGIATARGIAKDSAGYYSKFPIPFLLRP